MPAAPVGRAAALLRDLATLGAARVVLRTCNGLVEIVVCSMAELSVAPPWAVLSASGAFVHVELAALRRAELRGGGAPGHGAPPTIRFLGRCGSPCLVVVLDQASGAARRHQDIVFRRLRARWGAAVCLDEEHALEGRHWLQ